MRIHIPIPSFAPHGGIRVIIAIANGLAKLGHDIQLQPLHHTHDPNYWRFEPGVKIGHAPRSPDRLLITSPHSAHFYRHKRTVMHLQMLEHLFHGNSANFYTRSTQMYRCPAPMFSISNWNIRELRDTYKRQHEIHYIGNGVDTEHDFPLEYGERRDKRPTVLVEGWAAYNKCKDILRLAPKVAQRLRKNGAYIVAYGIVLPTDYIDVPHEFHLKPSLADLNLLYARATILLKASAYDARSCSPVEAMTKGTVTARAILEGDDDLVHSKTCLRVGYTEKDEDRLYAIAKKLLDDATLRSQLAENCYKHLAEHCQWSHWVGLIEKKLRSL